jgi:hypothetical protein
MLAADPEPWRRLLDPARNLREDPSARRALHPSSFFVLPWYGRITPSAPGPPLTTSG